MHRAKQISLQDVHQATTLRCKARSNATPLQSVEHYVPSATRRESLNAISSITQQTLRQVSHFMR